MKFNRIEVNKNFTTGEEIANSVAHGVGVLLGVAILVFVLVKSAKVDNTLYTVSMVIYSVSTIFLYINSVLYHALNKGKAKNVFERLDHLSIYILIAASYTPLSLVAIGGTKGIVICVIQWVIALIGVIFKAIWIKRFVKIHVLIYLIMGWMIIIFINSILKPMTASEFYLLLAGGLAYSVGVLFYVFRWFKYHHFVWHLFVLAGSLLLFFSIYDLK